MRSRTTFTLALAGGVLALLGLIGSVVFLFQPWRTCPYDDSPAACAMLPGDYAALIAFLALLIAGGLLAIGSLVASFLASGRRTSQQ
jgi:hypothetical protein